MSTTQVTTLGLAYDYGMKLIVRLLLQTLVVATKKVTFFAPSGSVMHYPAGAFAVDRRIPVIKALIGSPVLGQRKGFSTV